MSTGITPTGFVRKTFETIQTEIIAELQSAIGAAFNAELRPFKEIIGSASERLASLWELGEAAYLALDPDDATDAQLDAVSAITGTTRRGATFSTVAATVDLDAATTLPQGSIAAVDGNPDARFVTTEEITSTVAGPYAVPMQAEATGPIAAPAGTLTQIVSAVAGWNTVTNAADALQGQEIEGDPSLRVRREQELAGPGGATVDGIEADVSRVDSVTYVRVYENVSLITDGFGVPGKAFETVVLGGTDLDVGQAVWDNKPAGIETHGSTSQAVTDASGRTQTVEFTRATQVPLYVEYSLFIRGAEYAGDDALKAAVVAFASSAYTVGNDAIVSQLNAAALGVAGVIDINLATMLDDSGPPAATTNYIVARDALSEWDVSRVTVTTTEAPTD